MKISTNTRAVVTGGGSGLGRALCRELSRRGARIVVSDIDRDAAERTVDELRTDAFVVECDVSKPESVAALADQSEELLGGVDFVANNAGVAVAGPVGEVALDDWRWIMGVNLWGVVHGCHEFVPRFKKQGHGAILNVASAAGLLSAPQMAPYNVTKAGVVALSETLYGELAGSGVSVTVLCPTFFKTNIAASARGTDDSMRGFVEKLMTRSKVQAPEVAHIALDAVEHRELFAVPHADGRWLWRVKRALPTSYFRLVGVAARRGMLG